MANPTDQSVPSTTDQSTPITTDELSESFRELRKSFLDYEDQIVEVEKEQSANLEELSLTIIESINNTTDIINCYAVSIQNIINSSSLMSEKISNILNFQEDDSYTRTLEIISTFIESTDEAIDSYQTIISDESYCWSDYSVDFKKSLVMLNKAKYIFDSQYKFISEIKSILDGRPSTDKELIKQISTHLIVGPYSQISSIILI